MQDTKLCTVNDALCSASVTYDAKFADCVIIISLVKLTISYKKKKAHTDG